MKNYFWYNTCPICDQGRLFIMEDVSMKRVYLHCEECESGFIDPLQLESNSFLTLNEDYEYKFADFETIEKYGWTSFAKNHIPKNLVPNILPERIV